MARSKHDEQVADPWAVPVWEQLEAADPELWRVPDWEPLEVEQIEWEPLTFEWEPLTFNWEPLAFKWEQFEWLAWDE